MIVLASTLAEDNKRMREDIEKWKQEYYKVLATHDILVEEIKDKENVLQHILKHTSDIYVDNDQELVDIIENIRHITYYALEYISNRPSIDFKEIYPDRRKDMQRNEWELTDEQIAATLLDPEMADAYTPDDGDRAIARAAQRVLVEAIDRHIAATTHLYGLDRPVIMVDETWWDSVRKEMGI